MVQGHHNHIAPPGQIDAIVQWAGPRAMGMGAAVHIDHHRAPFGVQIRRPHIQEQAVFADRFPRAGLGRRRAVLSSVGDIAPGLGRQCGLEPARRGVGPVADPLEHLDPALFITTHATIQGRGDRRGPFLREGMSCGCAQGQSGQNASSIRANIHDVLLRGVCRSVVVQDAISRRRCAHCGFGMESCRTRMDHRWIIRP